MARAKIVKEEQVEVKETKPKLSKETFKSVGRRKLAIARVWIKLEKGPILVNDKPLEEYFASLKNLKIFEEPFRIVNRIGQISATVKVSGGGLAGQAVAVVHGISRALIEYDETFRSPLAKRKFLTRDPRSKERRKYGNAGKARARKQSPKR